MTISDGRWGVSEDRSTGQYLTGSRQHLDKVLQRKGPFCDESFTPGNVEEILGRWKIL